MNPRDGRVDVAPATIVPVLDDLRVLAKACSDAASSLTTRTPIMPVRFFLAWRPALESAAETLGLLAGELEFNAALQYSRLSRIEAAGGIKLRVPLAGFASDLGWAGRLEWDRLTSERGFDVVADPAGQSVHAVMGEADLIRSLWHVATVFLQGTPLYGVDRPGGREARHELVAMGINLTRLLPPWVLLEPEDGVAAYEEVAYQALDLEDLKSGDVFRWGGHMGMSLVTTKGLDALLAVRATTAAAATAPVAGAAWKGAARGAYKGANDATRVPTARSGGPRTRVGRAIRRGQDDVARFLETRVP